MAQLPLMADKVHAKKEGAGNGLSSERGALEFFRDELIQSRHHRRRHAAGPIPRNSVPEEGVGLDPHGGAPAPVYLHPLEALQTAEVHELAHHSGRLLLRREGTPHERRQRPESPRRVLQHVLVPEEQHLVGVPAAGLPVLERVAPLGPRHDLAVAEELERLLERRHGGHGVVGVGNPQNRRRGLLVEVPQGDERVLWISADVDDADAAAMGYEGVGQVGGEQTGRREQLLVPGVGLEEEDQIVGVGAVERVVGDGGRRVRHTVERREAECLEPCGAGLGKTREEHVGGPRLEPRVRRRDALEKHVRQPEAAVPAQPVRWEPGRHGQRRHYFRMACLSSVGPTGIPVCMPVALSTSVSGVHIGAAMKTKDLLVFQVCFKITMENTSVAPRLMSLHFLEEITNNFSNDRKIGVGSYGSVYKGEQKNGEAFAVKLLHYIPGLDDLEFKKEYLNLASLQHKNVVRLIGYCHETRREFLPFNGRIELVEVNKRALCFEYLPNGSLDKCLSDELNGHDWHTRYTIIKGICEGLKYLHEDLESPMYHLDLKPGNVLLDENMVAKIADFGLSRMFGGERTQMTKSAIGTIGYVPPEFIDAAIISDKFDIFSLGVIMIKILTGPTGYFRSEEMSSQEFIELVHANWRSRLHAASVHIFDSCSQQVKICIEIALSCLQGDRSKRPSIGLIVNKLNETETLIQSPHKDIGSSTYKVIESRSMRDKKQYTNSGSLAQALTQFEDDSSLHSESAHLEVIDEEKTVAPNSDDSSLLSAGTTNVEVNDEEESTTAPPLSETRSTPFERPRLDLVIVADVSSSIENLRMKELKDAMRSAVGWLSAMDRLSVVVCASPQPLCPLREVTGNGRQELLKLIDDRIKSSPYGNNIGNGLLTGLNVLADRKVSAGRVGVIFLVCDNQQKPGNASQVSAGNVPVYTFGFGADSKHTVLQAVAANSTGGTFSRVPDVVEYGAGLQTAFSRCLTLLLHGFADTEPPLYLPAAYFGDIPVSHCYDDDGEQQEEEQADIPEPKGEALLRLWPWRAGGHRSSDLS